MIKINYQKLYDNYVKKQKSLTYCAKLFKCSTWTILNRLRKRSLYIRSLQQGIKLTRKIIIGQTFGRWKVLKLSYKKRYRHSTQLFYLCKCKCGTIRTVKSDSLYSNRSKSCGCLQRELLSKKQRKEKSIVHYNMKYAGYKQGAIKRKLSFKISKRLFIKIAKENCFYCGEKPKKYINGIDRINNKKGYIKSNCVSCCTICNRAKNIQSEREFYIWLEKFWYHYNFKKRKRRK